MKTDWCPCPRCARARKDERDERSENRKEKRMDIVMPDQCSTCCYFKNGDIQICQVRPPDSGGWAKVSPADRCGEYEISMAALNAQGQAVDEYRAEQDAEAVKAKEAELTIERFLNNKWTARAMEILAR